MSRHQVRVYPLPDWLDAERVLGPGSWQLRAAGVAQLRAQASLDEAEAADLTARLRGIGLGGSAIAVEVDPPLSRAAIRRARQQDARRRRDVTPASDLRGLRMDDEARVSWTPAALAQRMAARAAGWRVVDAGCGAGGNAIAFAAAGCEVVAIERDAARLEMARHNVAIAGVRDRVELLCGDALELIPGLGADLLFVDPPWGVDWDRTRTDAVSLAPLPALLERIAKPDLAGHFAHVWCKLPPSIAPASLPGAWTLEAMFGEHPGDWRRVKLVWARRQP
jgi:hypothetical protein